MTSKTREGPPWGPLPGKGRHGSGPFEIGLRVNDGPCPRWGLGTLSDKRQCSRTPCVQQSNFRLSNLMNLGRT